MNAARIISVLTSLTAAVSKCVMLALVVPLAAALLFSIPLTPALALIGSTFIIEYGAAPVGIGLGLPPGYVFFVLTCVALGVILFLYDIFETLGEQSDRVNRFLEHSRKRASESAILSRYGTCGLVFIVLSIGFYFCPPIAWVCGWDKKKSVVLTLAGYCTVSAALILATTGLLPLLPQG